MHVATGDHCFEVSQMPPHCINVFVPLVDLTKKNGATEFAPGSHLLEQQQHKQRGRNVDALPDGVYTTGIHVPAGGAVCFDYRVQHRGGANFTSDDRCVVCGVGRSSCVGDRGIIITQCLFTDSCYTFAMQSLGFGIITIIARIALC